MTKNRVFVIRLFIEELRIFLEHFEGDRSSNKATSHVLLTKHSKKVLSPSALLCLRLLLVMCECARKHLTPKIPFDYRLLKET